MSMESGELKNAMLALSTKLDRAINSVSSKYSIRNFPRALDSGLVFDPTGTNESNHITNEMHDPKSFGIFRIIWPVAGCFYGSSMHIYHANRELIYGRDYLFGGDFRGKYDIFDVFSCIVLLHDHEEPVTLEYQAVGKVINKRTVTDMNKLVSDLREKSGNLDELHVELNKYCNNAPIDEFTYILSGDKGSWYTFAEIKLTGNGGRVWYVFDINLCGTVYNTKLILDTDCVVKLKSINNSDPVETEPDNQPPKCCIRALWDKRDISDTFSGILQIRVDTNDTMLTICNKNTDNMMLLKPLHGELHVAPPKPMLPNLKRFNRMDDNAKGACILVAKNGLYRLISDPIKLEQRCVERIYLDKNILFDPRCTSSFVISIDYGDFIQTEVIDHRLSVTELVGTIELYNNEGKLRYAVYRTGQGWRMDFVRDGGTNNITVTRVVVQTV